MYKQIDKCRGCSNKDRYRPVIDLGEHYVVDFVKERDDNALRAPLKLIRCSRCGLIQLLDSVNRDRLYKKFWYRSGINESMRIALKNIVAVARQAVPLGLKSKVLDIGCNDGTLLGMYPGFVTKVGIDPCQDLVEDGLNAHNMDIGISDYFSYDAVYKFGPFKIITAIAMFYDLEDPAQFLKHCKAVLDKDGVLIVQMNYLAGMLKQNAVDNICHEHLTYFTATTMDYVVSAAGLEIQGAETNDINGGSIRFYITHPGHTLSGMTMDQQVSLHVGYQNLLIQENLNHLDMPAPYLDFAARISRITATLREYILAHRDVYVYGASTRGSTLLQCLGLPEGVFQGAAERDQHKLGLMTVGTWIKIYPEAYCRERAKLFVVLPWHFAETIKRREDNWIARDGTMLFPLPEPYILTSEGETKLMSEVSQ